MTALLILFAALNLADFILTRRILAAGGRELNMMVNATMRAIGVIPALIVWKAGAVAAITYIAVTYGIDVPWMLLIDAGYCWVVYHNWQVARRMKLID